MVFTYIGERALVLKAMAMAPDTAPNANLELAFQDFRPVKVFESCIPYTICCQLTQTVDPFGRTR